jgi:alcohol dehydrogenase
MFCPYLKGTGVDVQGGHAEYMLMNADATYLIPDEVSYEQAAPIFCAGYTVYSGLRWADPKPHERVAVLGIGGLGHLAVQYAKAAGFETIAVSHSPDKDKMIRDLGADEIVRMPQIRGIGTIRSFLRLACETLYILRVRRVTLLTDDST